MQLANIQQQKDTLSDKLAKTEKKVADMKAQKKQETAINKKSITDFMFKDKHGAMVKPKNYGF